MHPSKQVGHLCWTSGTWTHEIQFPSSQRSRALERLTDRCRLWPYSILHGEEGNTLLTMQNLNSIRRHSPSKEWLISSKGFLLPRLVWLGGMSAGIWTERLPVRFLITTHAWGAGQAPSWCLRGNQSKHLSTSFLSLSFPSLPFSLKIDK